MQYCQPLFIFDKYFIISVSHKKLDHNERNYIQLLMHLEVLLNQLRAAISERIFRQRDAS